MRLFLSTLAICSLSLAYPCLAWTTDAPPSQAPVVNNGGGGGGGGSAKARANAAAHAAATANQSTQQSVKSSPTSTINNSESTQAPALSLGGVGLAGCSQSAGGGVTVPVVGVLFQGSNLNATCEKRLNAVAYCGVFGRDSECYRRMHSLPGDPEAENKGYSVYYDYGFQPSGGRTN